MPKTGPRLEDKYDVLELLGEGGFGYVHRGVDKKTKQEVAIKFMTKEGVDDQDIADYRKEVGIMSKLSHPNIVRLFEWFEDDDFMYIVMELVGGGELFDELLERDKFTEKDAAKVIKDVLKGVQYLHSNGIAHRDLKPENLLLGGPNHDIIKIADFGLSKDFAKSNLQTHVGTHNYMAPEILLGERYTEKVDIFAIGVITYMLLAGYYPFEDDNPTKLTKLILDLKYDYPDRYWRGISDGAKKFIDRCFTYEPTQRPSSTDLLSDQWIVDRTPPEGTLDSMARLASIVSTREVGMKWKSLAKLALDEPKAEKEKAKADATEKKEKAKGEEKSPSKEKKAKADKTEKADKGEKKHKKDKAGKEGEKKHHHRKHDKGDGKEKKEKK